LQAAAIGAGGVVVGATATLLTGIFHPRATLLGPVIWAGPRDRKAVALTFDDGPHARFSPAVSEILARRGGRGTFFCVGRFVVGNPALARELVAAGHELGNHTWRHGMSKDLVFSSLLIEDLRRCQDAIGEAVGSAPIFYRPTVGIRTHAVHVAARQLGLRVVTWSHAARDGIRRFTARRAHQLTSRVISGDVLALHDGTLTERVEFRQGTIEHLPSLVEALLDRGFSLVTLSELLAPRLADQSVAG
jgi:peptidoglycan/xylan/chitin deacetylase (PgdA/CDA1 family)